MMCEGESHGIVWASNKCKAFQKLLAFRLGTVKSCLAYFYISTGCIYGFPKIFIATKQYS